MAVPTPPRPLCGFRFTEAYTASLYSSEGSLEGQPLTWLGAASSCRSPGLNGADPGQVGLKSLAPGVHESVKINPGPPQGQRGVLEKQWPHPVFPGQPLLQSAHSDMGHG